MKMRFYIGILFSVVLLMSIGKDDKVMKKTSDGTYIVNTTTICSDKGLKGPTPVEVYIKKGKVVMIVPLANQETPGFFAKVTNGLLPQYENLSLSKAKALAEKGMVDACTGATYSTMAVQKNISAALEYYEKHK